MTTRINDIFGSNIRDLIDRSGGKLAGGTCSASGPFSKDTVDEAWSVLCAPGHADADVIDACRTLIEHCQDGRRKTAEAMLEILKGQRR